MIIIFLTMKEKSKRFLSQLVMFERNIFYVMHIYDKEVKKILRTLVIGPS